MAANTTPIFVATPRSSFVSTGVNANTALDGTGTVATAFTAGANGSKIEQINLVNLGTAVATVVRIFINNGATNATAANNSLLYEVPIIANTLSQTAASSFVTLPTNIILPSGYKINVTTGTAIAAGIQVTCQGGDY